MAHLAAPTWLRIRPTYTGRMDSAVRARVRKDPALALKAETPVYPIYNTVLLAAQQLAEKVSFW